MKKNKYIILFISILLLMTAFRPPKPLIVEETEAWSGDTHGWLSEVAIRLMPSPWDERLQESLNFFLEHSREPDRIRGEYEDTGQHTEYMKEAPRHYVDHDVRPELYGNATHHPQPEFSMVYNSANPFESSDYQLGVACWAAENWSIRLTDDLKNIAYGSADWETVLMDMCMLAHYVQDSWMPFHAVSYYDGQVTPSVGDRIGELYDGGPDGNGQSGIHGYVENTLLQQLYPTEVQNILDTVNATPTYSSVYMTSLRGISTGKAVADELLAVEDVHGYTFPSSDWIHAVWDYTGGENGSLTQRLINASIETANAWYTSFVDAGLIDDPAASSETSSSSQIITTSSSSTTSSSTSETSKESTSQPPTSTTYTIGWWELLLLSTFSMVIYRYKRKRK